MNACFGAQQPSLLGPPTLAGYKNFLYSVVAIPVAALPPFTIIDTSWTADSDITADSDVTADGGASISVPNFNIQLSFSLALDIVSTWLQYIQGDIYTIAVYNLATDRLINFCPDQSNQTYFAKLREKFKINQFVAGVVQADYDQGTGTTLVVPDAFKNLTMMDLANLSTPFGRQYLQLAQTIGTLWGLT